MTLAPLMERGSVATPTAPAPSPWPGHRHVEVGCDAVGEGIDPAMDGERLAARPGFLHEDVGGDVLHLAHDVELAKPVEARSRIADRRERCALAALDLADRMEPVIDQA